MMAGGAATNAPERKALKNSLLKNSVRDEMAERRTGDNELQAGHRPDGVEAKMVERNPAKATSSARPAPAPCPARE